MGQRDSVAGVTLPELVGILRLKAPVHHPLRKLRAGSAELVSGLPQVVIQGAGGQLLNLLAQLFVGLKQLHEQGDTAPGILLQQLLSTLQDRRTEHPHPSGIRAAFSAQSSDALFPQALQVAP